MECRREAEHLLALSLDPMHDYICWLADGLNPYDFAAQMRVIRLIAVVGGKAGTRRVTSARGRGILGALIDGLEERAAWSASRPFSFAQPSIERMNAPTCARARRPSVSCG